VTLQFLKINPSSGVPIYLQLAEQIKHAVDICALMPGDQLPGIRTLSQELVLSVTTVIKAYAELENEGVVEIRHGSGAFIVDQERSPKTAKRLQRAKEQVSDLVRKLQRDGITEAEIRRLFEAEFVSSSSSSSEMKGGNSR
jgi:GntR family transcriptional regulator